MLPWFVYSACEYMMIKSMNGCMNDQRQTSVSSPPFITLLSAQKVIPRKYGNNSKADGIREISGISSDPIQEFDSKSMKGWHLGHLIKKESFIYLI